MDNLASLREIVENGSGAGHGLEHYIAGTEAFLCQQYSFRAGSVSDGDFAIADGSGSDHLLGSAAERIGNRVEHAIKEAK